LKTSKVPVFMVKSTIYGHGRGWCFTPNDFLATANYTAVRQALSRLQKDGFIRRLSWGLYEYPRMHEKLGTLPPDIQQVVSAVARKDESKVLPSGAMAANLLGLSTQVPAKAVYLTEGLSKRIKIGKQEVIFKKTTPKNLAAAGTVAGLLIQALKHMGQRQVTEDTVLALKHRLSSEDHLVLKKHMRHAPVWIQGIMRDIVEGKRRG
jgi:hypothetical protein